MPKSVSKLIYLDHAAATPVRPEVLRIMQPFFTKKFGNPSSIYKLGLEAKLAVENARKSAAQILNSRPEEIIFTAGGTESINLAILGTASAWRSRQKIAKSRGRGKKLAGSNDTKGHIITSAIEHHAVLHAVDQLAREGFAVSEIKVDKFGFFDLEELQKTVRQDTILVSLMYANNEIGTIEPIRQISRIIREENSRRAQLSPIPLALSPILFHTDACQAAGYLDLNVQSLGVDLMSLNAGKIYGPKQTGLLFVRRGVDLEPIIFGGGQEKNLRSGTENPANIAGFAKALELADKEKQTETQRLSALRDYAISQILKIFPLAFLNGPRPVKINQKIPRQLRKKIPQPLDNRLPNNINITFPKIDGEALVLHLDAQNIAASTGSACTTSEPEASHVLRALGMSQENAAGSLRITLGKSTTKNELDIFLKKLPRAVRLSQIK